MSDYYKLYGGELSYYTGKVRAYLRYKGLDWQEVRATREVYKSVILPNIGAAIIPVLAANSGEFIQDSTAIIDFLESRHPQSTVYPTGPKQKLVALLLELFGDEWLLIPAMHYRWSVLDQQREFIYREFGAVSAPQETEEEQIRIGEKVCQRFKSSVTGLGINSETIPAIERSYDELLDQLNTHFLQHDFLLGSKPSIGDFGLMGPLYAHLGRDPVPKAIMQAQAPAVFQWVQRMNAPQPLSGEYLADDEVPDTLLPILLTLCAEHLPDVLDVIRHNDRWLVEHPGGDIPRYLGMHEFTIGGVTSERAVNSFSQWMFQRSQDHYQSLNQLDKEAVDALLRQVGGYESMQVTADHRLARKAGQLELVADDD